MNTAIELAAAAAGIQLNIANELVAAAVDSIQLDTAQDMLLVAAAGSIQVDTANELVAAAGIHLNTVTELVVVVAIDSKEVWFPFLTFQVFPLF